MSADATKKQNTMATSSDDLLQLTAGRLCGMQTSFCGNLPKRAGLGPSQLRHH